MTQQALIQAVAANNQAAAAAAGLPVQLNTGAPVITTTSDLTPLQLHSADSLAQIHPSFQTIPGTIREEEKVFDIFCSGYHNLGYHPAAAAAGPASLLAAAGGATPTEPATPPPQTAGAGQAQLLQHNSLPGLTQLSQLHQLSAAASLQPQLASPLTFSPALPLLFREGESTLLCASQSPLSQRRDENIFETHQNIFLLIPCKCYLRLFSEWTRGM